jgi:aerobic carbon-monoxide dehydrogenase medium subunit
MKPRPFTYLAPTSLDEALEALAEHSFDAKVLAGGQSLAPLLNFRMASPEYLIDINDVDKLQQVRRVDGGFEILALARQRAVERSPELRAAFPLLPAALQHVAHPQIRNRGTICGSLAHADPAAELPTVMTALGARMRLASVRGEREVAAEDFFQFHFTTSLEDDEILVGVTIDDLPAGTSTGFTEFAPRRGDFALASVAGVLTRASDRTVESVQLVASGVAARPQRLTAAEEVLLGHEPTPDAIAAAERAARGEVDPTGDIHASADYRRHLVGVLARRVLTTIAEEDHRV